MKTITSKLIQATIFTLLLSLAASADPGNYSPEGAGFSVWLPSAPQKSVQSDDTPVGPVKSTTYEASKGESDFAVTVTKLPSVALIFKGEDSILDEARQDLLKQLGGEQTSWDKSSGMLSYTTADKVGQAHLLISDSQLYIVNGITPKSDQGKLADFLGSFHTK